VKPTAERVTESADLSGKTTLVTGASSGLGRECARVLALRGARVLLVCRNAAKAAQAVNEFGPSIGREAARRCEIRVCDTAGMDSVRSLIGTLEAERLPIDRLFLNAGVFGLPFRLTDDGFEYTYAANYVGHFLLVHGLASAGLLSPAARIVATISDGAYKNPLSRLDLAMLQDAKSSRPRLSNLFASPNSKILLLLMMQEFSRRVEGTRLARVRFNGADPGPTLTDNVNQMGAVLRVLGRIAGPLLLKPVGEGAAVLLWAATSPALEGRTGRLFSHALEEVPMPRKCTDAELAARAWTATEEILGLAPFSPR